MLGYGFKTTQRKYMKIDSKQFRDRYNIPISTESELKKHGLVPFEKVGRQVVYDQEVTDKLAEDGKLGPKAYIAISNIDDTTEEHY